MTFLGTMISHYSMMLNTRDLIPFAAQYEAGALNMGKADVN